MSLIKRTISSIKNKKYQVAIERLDTSKDDANYDRHIKKVMNLLSYTRKSGVSYSAGKFHTGYHSFRFKDYEFVGQRNPKKRFEKLPVSLEGLTVLDIGCNQGGMLYAFSDQIKYGIGIDYDSRMINAANKIKSYTQSDNLDFYVFDLENEPLMYLHDFLPDEKVDIVFLLSVCMWIKNWKEVIDFCKQISGKMIFETNGKPEQQQEQITYLQEVYQHVEVVTEKSEDDPSQKLRQLYYCY